MRRSITEVHNAGEHDGAPRKGCPHCAREARLGGVVRIEIQAGQTWRGTKFFGPAMFDVSTDYAERLIREGVAVRV